MEALLALIGILVLIHFAGKWCRQVGDFLERLGDEIAVRGSSFRSGRGTAPDVEKVKEQLHVINGEGTEKDYWDNVEKEISSLEQDMNRNKR